MQHEPKNQQDKNAVAVVKNGKVVGHVPRGLASTKQGTGIIRHFLTKKGCTAEVKVVGKAVNRDGGYGMEVPCLYRFAGPQNLIKLLENLLDIENNLSVRQNRKTESRRLKSKRTTEQESSCKKKSKK